MGTKDDRYEDDDLDDLADAIRDKVRRKLGARGVKMDFSFPGMRFLFGGRRGKIVCVGPDLRESVEEMGKTSRENVVAVRVDRDTLEQLDAWVEAGAVKSRSEAAALFIREGLALRREELDELRDALDEVEKAKDNLRRRTSEIFGHSGGDSDGDAAQGEADAGSTT